MADADTKITDMPFHQSCVDVINRLAESFGGPERRQPNATQRMDRLQTEAAVVARFIKLTKIPEDADKILAAWTEMKEATDLELDYGVSDRLNDVIASAAQKAA